MSKIDNSARYALNGIKTEQFAIVEENYAPKKSTNLGTAIQFKLDQTKKQIAVFLTHEFVQGKNIFLKIQVSCHFKLEENSWNSFIKKNKIVVPKGFLAHLATITTGTSRGVLFAKTESTPFTKYIIPTQNVAEMINEDAVFEILD